ncbi:MAG: hypothetical protein ACJAT3_001572 [Akkermansiaceae bacterium]
MIVAKPEFSDVLPPLVIGYLIGREMSVVIDYWQVLRRVVEKIFGCLGEEKEVVVKVCSSHVAKLGQEQVGRKGELHRRHD